ncbi:MAG: GNAT family N-acetyltransferase [Candidatus Hydrogenedentota bacterium]|nr:MAG: GNAT family N-acetyltransferase [Candidatus Hydrogenedentota bacterium]
MRVHVSELFVLESERGKEIGRRLLEAVKKEAVERGCVRLQLLTGRNSMSYERGSY